MKYYFLLIFISLSLMIKAQTTSPFRVLYNEMYYQAYLYFLEHEKEFLNSKYSNSYIESKGTLYSFLGKYNKAKELYTLRNKRMGYIPNLLKQINLTGFDINQDVLIDLYNKYNVALFNENHLFSEHRAFLYSQLKILKSLGYNQLALETLNKEDSFLYKRKYPIKNTGFYTNDPVYGNLIRKALELEFTLISYDDYSKDREKVQAENIYRQYDPKKGKLIVFGGMGHIAETGERKMMGQYLKNMLREDVLSISQFTPFHVQPIFPKAIQNNIFLQKDSTNFFDYYIYFRPEKSNSNIPYWYEWMDFKSKSLKDIYDKELIYPTLIQITMKDEMEGVPVYQYIIEKAEDVSVAFPKNGTYILKVIDKSGVKEKKVKL